ncbi:kinase-like domain-containing protein [Phascolomyces articulosus]|uniref:non-specific serine/threonine protein kinase n=1 Tax=Phascolomyces articulosus TaxID=60185 RepID=A0AAD5K675_9FUNG|nr:kinase-like domain-containing protein [Phascolomyces articulosus]
MSRQRRPLSSSRDENGWQKKIKTATVTALCTTQPPSPPLPTPSRSWNCLRKSDEDNDATTNTGDSSKRPSSTPPTTTIIPKKNDTRKRVEMYGDLYGKIGEGSNGVVLIYKRNTMLYAVKRFRKPRRNENNKDYMKRLASEYCIASSVSAHPNILTTIDLVLKDDGYCTVMEYCTGGDLFSCIKEGRMNIDYERACCFKQIIRGVAYLHSLGVAHCDLKPENLLWTARGQLKIADFGSARVFRTPYDMNDDVPKKKVTLSAASSTTITSTTTSLTTTSGKQYRRKKNKPSVGQQMGSLPYLAPEYFNKKETIEWQSSRPDAGDIWSVGIILYCLYRNGLPWKQATKSDSGHREYLRCQEVRNFVLFSALPSGPRCLLYQMLDTNVQSRISAADILATDPWCKSSMVCRDGRDFANNIHQHTNP